MSNTKQKSVIECHYLLKVKLPKEFQEKFNIWEKNIIYRAPETWVTGAAWREYIYFLNLLLPKLSEDNHKKYPWLKELHQTYKEYVKN